MTYSNVHNKEVKLEKCLDNGFLTDVQNLEIVESENVKQFMQQFSSFLLRDPNEIMKKNVKKVFVMLSASNDDDVVSYAKHAFFVLAKTLVSSHNSVNGCSGFGKSSYFAVELLLYLLTTHHNKMSKEQLRGFYQILYVLPSGCIMSENKQLIKSIKQMLKVFKSKHCDLYEDSVKTLIELEPKVPTLSYLSIVCEIGSGHLKSCPLLEYLKLCFNDKVVVPHSVLKNIRMVLKNSITTSDIFKSDLLNTMSRMILRAPEKALVNVSIILHELSHIDLSSCSDEIMKNLSTQTIAKSDALRSGSSVCILELVKLISETESINKITNCLVALLKQGGSEKVSHVETRNNIYNLLSNISMQIELVDYNSKASVVENVVTQMIILLDKESAESTIVCLLNCIEKWACLLSNNIPNYLILFFNQIISKRANAGNRFYFFNCINSCYDRVEKLSSLSNILGIKEYIYNFSKASHSITGLQENLPIIDLLLRYEIDVEDGSESQTLNNLFSLIGIKTSVENSKMLSDSFLQSASMQCIKCLISILKNLLVHFYDTLDKLPNHLQCILLLLYNCCLYEKYEIRKTALNTVKYLARSQNGEDIVSHYLTHIGSLNLQTPESVISSKFWPVDNVAEIYDVYDINTLKPIIQKQSKFINMILSISYENNYVKKIDLNRKIDKTTSMEDLKYPPQWSLEKRAKILYQALVPLNQKFIVYFFPHFWANHCARLLDSIEDLIVPYGQKIIEHLTNLDFTEYNNLSLVNCITENFPAKYIEEILAHILDNLNDDKYFDVSSESIGIMNTKDRYLYNKQMLDTLPKYEVSKGNIKRETKNYSYKEQMAEMELRKELESKKINKRKAEMEQISDNPLDLVANKLTKKQMEMIQNELEKEKTIRERMKKLETEICGLCDIIELVFENRIDCIKSKFDKIVLSMSHLITKSEIGRIRACLLMVKLGTISNLGKRDCVWILRVLLMDSTKYEDIKPLWVNNHSFERLNYITNPFCDTDLEKYSKAVLKKIACDSNLDFNTFLQLLPTIFKMIDALFNKKTDKSDDYLQWLDLDDLELLMKIISHQLTNSLDVNNCKLLNLNILDCMVTSIKSCEDSSLQNSINDIMFTYISILNKENRRSGLKLSDTGIYESIVDCIITNTDRARIVGLECLNLIEEFEFNKEYNNELMVYLWMMQFDQCDEVVQIAKMLIEGLNMEIKKEVLPKILQYVGSKHEKIMSCAVKSLTEIVSIYKEELNMLMKLIFELYKNLAYRTPAVYDDLGRILKPMAEDRWYLRIGTGKALQSLAPLLTEFEDVECLFDFLISTSLADTNSTIRQCMIKSGRIVIENVGDKYMKYFLPLFEDYLTHSTNDLVRECVVIFLGSLASHLNVDDERFINIFAKLISNLSSESEDVQKAVSETLEPLIKAYNEDKQREVVNDLLSVLDNSRDIVQLRGAAYGLAGILKAVGVTRLKLFNINDKLIEAIKDKKNEQRRQMALFTYEQISLKMGRLFEPYVPTLLKQLQDAFGDPNTSVRKAADNTAKVIMGNLTAPGVKLILEPLLEGLHSNQWRTKAISAEMLGSMSHCAPRQLSNCLPSIVPQILGILSDSHPNVVNSGRQALREIGSVIQNPEMQAIVAVVIEALCDPNRKINEGLDILINTKFIHKVDPASLALMMSMVTRTFRERRSETKRKAAQIIANLHSLTEDKDLQPYCPNVLPGLKTCLTDPDPSVRTVASLALGTIARVMSSDIYKELVSWLMSTLKDETSSVNRSGAAQGLSEVMYKKGASNLDMAMPDILENAENVKNAAYVRDGYLMLYIHLPRLFQDKFSQYVPQILPAILKSFSDEAEYVRETSLLAAKGIIQTYSHIAIETMLPNLESGLFDRNWRIRDASIRLLGELLFQFIGISGKGTTIGTNEDDTFASSNNQQVISQSLGQNKFNTVLSKLYLSRLDVAYQVKQNALHIWKLVVYNTVRTLKSILPNLLQVVMECMSDEIEDNRVMAKNALIEVVKKVGEEKVPDILSTLVSKFNECEPSHRVGLCDALASILLSFPRDDISEYIDYVLPVFKCCICDDDKEVRVVAVRIFDALHKSMGVKIVEIVIPELVSRLNIPGKEEETLNGLSTLVAEKGRSVIVSLIPKLTSPQVQTRALSHLALVGGDAFSNHVVNVLPALLDSVAHKIGTDEEEKEVDNCCQVFLSLTDSQMIMNIIRELQGNMTKEKSIQEQAAALNILARFLLGLQEKCMLVGNTIIMNHVPLMIRSVLKLFIEDEKMVLLSAFDCFNSMNKALEANNIEYVKDIRDSISLIIREQAAKLKTTTDKVKIPGLCLTERGILPLTDIYKEALVNGRAEMKDVAAGGIDDCLGVSGDEVIVKAAVKITGPLIRTMSDRHSFATKAYVVSALGKLVLKCSANIKLFHTQILAILIRCLRESNNCLRYKSEIALSHFISVYPKPDNMFKDLLKQELGDTNDYKNSGFEAIRMCVEVAGSRLSNECLLLAIDTFKNMFTEKDDQIRKIAAAIVGCAIGSFKDVADVTKHIQEIILLNTSVLTNHAVAIVLMLVCKTNPSKIFDDSLKDLILSQLRILCKSDKVFLASAGYRALGYCIQYSIELPDENMMNELIQLLQVGYQHQSMEIKELVIDICSYLIWKDEERTNVLCYCKPLLSILITGYRAKENALRLKSEKAILDMFMMSLSTRKLLDNTVEAKAMKEKSGASRIPLLDETVYKICHAVLDQNAKLAVAEIVNRFKKLLSSSINKEQATYCPELDNTYNPIPGADFF